MGLSLKREIYFTAFNLTLVTPISFFSSFILHFFSSGIPLSLATSPSGISQIVQTFRAIDIQLAWGNLSGIY
jgi:hypothetical protein